MTEAIALVRERVQVQGPVATFASAEEDWRWLVPVLLAWGRRGEQLTVIPERTGVTIGLPQGLSAAAQEALQRSWQGEEVPPEALPVDPWDWYGCRLLAGLRPWHLRVQGDRLIFRADDRQRWLVVSANDELAASVLATLHQQGQTATHCRQADEALTLLRTGAGFCHVAIDRRLPVVDGDTLAHTIAADPHLTGVRLIALGDGPVLAPWHGVWASAKNEAAASAWVDWEGLWQICEGDRAIAGALFQQFFQAMPEGLAQLTAALAHGDWHQFAQTAHYLKGVAATAHVYRLPALCHALQEAPHHGDPQGGVATLQASFAEVMAAQTEILDAIAAWPSATVDRALAVRKLRVLLADDDEGTLRVLAHALQDVAAVTAVTGGEEAWQHLQTGGFDMAICDWSMPDTSGIVLCQRLRWVAQSAMPFVLLTARADEDFRQLAFAAGVSRYFVKPVNPSALRAAALELTHGV
ncbi:MAG: response regulator [Oscillatoriales cyanobacterium SM2_1_8]|nr:response regulator [Oscillatoriales cyanobacterium SM2_1_8]